MDFAISVGRHLIDVIATGAVTVFFAAPVIGLVFGSLYLFFPQGTPNHKHAWAILKILALWWVASAAILFIGAALVSHGIIGLTS